MTRAERVRAVARSWVCVVQVFGHRNGLLSVHLMWCLCSLAEARVVFWAFEGSWHFRLFFTQEELGRPPSLPTKDPGA